MLLKFSKFTEFKILLKSKSNHYYIKASKFSNCKLELYIFKNFKKVKVKLIDTLDNKLFTNYKRTVVFCNSFNGFY